jgi:hypothetical protein
MKGWAGLSGCDVECAAGSTGIVRGLSGGGGNPLKKAKSSGNPTTYHVHVPRRATTGGSGGAGRRNNCAGFVEGLGGGGGGGGGVWRARRVTVVGFAVGMFLTSVAASWLRASLARAFPAPPPAPESLSSFAVLTSGDATTLRQPSYDSLYHYYDNPASSDNPTPFSSSSSSSSSDAFATSPPLSDAAAEDAAVTSPSSFTAPATPWQRWSGGDVAASVGRELDQGGEDERSDSDHDNDHGNDGGDGGDNYNDGANDDGDNDGDGGGDNNGAFFTPAGTGAPEDEEEDMIGHDDEAVRLLALRDDGEALRLLLRRREDEALELRGRAEASEATVARLWRLVDNLEARAAAATSLVGLYTLHQL